MDASGRRQDRTLCDLVLERGVQQPVEIPTPADAGQVDYLAFSPKGVLWATGPGKLYRYDGREWKMFTTEDGLQGQTISSVVALSDSEVWIAYNDVVSVTHAQMDSTGKMQMEHHHWDWAILGHDSKRPSLVQWDGWNRHSLSRRQTGAEESRGRFGLG